MYEAVTEAGATTLNIPDTVGYAIPSEFGNLVERGQAPDQRPGASSASTATTTWASPRRTPWPPSQAGARQVEVTINGLGERAGNASLEEVVMALRTRPGQFPSLAAGVQTEQITPASSRWSAT